jgi:hypothetical protein
MLNFLSRLSTTLENSTEMNNIYDYGLNRREYNDSNYEIKSVSHNSLELFETLS